MDPNTYPPNATNTKRLTFFWYSQDFPPILGKPLLYLFEDENLDFYHPYQCGYEEIFGLFREMRSVSSELESTVGGDAKWKLLLERLPKGDIKREEPRKLTQAQMEMEEEDLSIHIIDMFTGFPKKMTKKH